LPTDWRSTTVTSCTVSQNLLGTDTLSLTVSGTFDLASGDFAANAAGIIVSPPTTNTGNRPGETSANSDNPALKLCGASNWQ